MRHTSNPIQTGKFLTKHLGTIGKAALSSALLCLLAIESVQAAQSWSKTPSWAVNRGGQSTQTKRNSDSLRPRKNLTPFAPGSHNIALDLGQVFLMGDLSENYSNNIGFQVHYTYGVSDLFGFDSSVGYSSHDSGEFSMLSLKTGLRLNLAWYDKVVPYAVGGLGFYKPSFEFGNAEGDIQTNSPILFGLHLGGGVDLVLTDRFFFGAGLAFHDIFGTREQTLVGLKELGGSYTSFLLHAGMSL